MSLKFLQAKKMEEKVFLEQEKAALLEQSKFLEDLSLDLQSMRFMAY